MPTAHVDPIYARATDLKANHHVFVTRLPIQSTAADARDALLARVTRVMMATAPLSPSRTPAIGDAFIEGDGLFLVAPSEPDASLRTVISLAGRMDVPTAARFGLDLLVALNEAHEIKLIHGAIDPDSVSITANGSARIRGFGVHSLRHDPALPLGIDLTTRGFAAPELAAGETPSEATDLFGLGAVLYFAVEGHGPFERDDPLLSLIDTMNEEPWPARSLGPLESLVTSLLSRNPDDRPTSKDVASILDGLFGPRRELTEAVLAAARGDDSVGAIDSLVPPSDTVTSTEESEPERAGRRISRRALILTGIGVLVAGGAATAAIEVVDRPDASPGPDPELAPSPSSSPSVTVPSGPEPGTLRWSVAGPLGLYLRPIVVGDIVISNGDSMQAVHVSDGSTAWSMPGQRRHISKAGEDAIVVQDGPDGAHRLRTLNPADGTTIRSVPLSTAVLLISVVDGIAYIIGGPHATDRIGSVLQAVDITTGRLVWKYTVAVYLTNSPVVDAAHVYVAGPSGIFAVDRFTGGVRWRNTTMQGVQRSVRLVADGLVSTRGQDGIYTLAQDTGHQVWVVRQPDIPYASSEFSLANGIVYASGIGTATISGKIRAIEEQTGAIQWTADPADGKSHAVVSGDTVYSTGTTAVIALDSAGGTVKWHYSFPANRGISTVEPVVTGGLVIVPTAGGHLNAIETGQL